MKDRAIWIAGLAMTAVAVAGGLAYVASKNAAATNPNPAPTPVAGTKPVSFILAPGTLGTPQTVAVPSGQTLTISLPAGASWSANNANYAVTGAYTTVGAALPASGNAPLTLTYSGTPDSGLYLLWTDASGTAQASSVVTTTA
jgi:hypothetical protein